MSDSSNVGEPLPKAALETRVLTAKQRRTIEHAAARLFTVKSWTTWEKGSLSGSAHLTRQIRLRNRQTWFLSDSGAAHLQTIATTLTDADYFDGKADFSDIWGACRDTLQLFLSEKMMPENSDEFLAPVRASIAEHVGTFTYVISIYGVRLKDIDRAPLAGFRLVRPDAALIHEEAVSDVHGSLSAVMKQMDPDCWLVGSTHGTERVAQAAFFDQARLCAGFLAVLAAATFEHGSQAFRIGVAVSPEEQRTPVNVYMFWDSAGDRSLGVARQWRQGQDYEIDRQLLDQITDTPALATALQIIQKQDRTDLENSIVSAVFWFSDAHKDPNPVMRFVKFWSCIETLFSRTDEITQAVSVGTAAVLAFGPFRHVGRGDYIATKKRLAALYAKRSKAVHAGERHHVLYKDLAELSQWIAWLIISMAQLTEQYSSRERVLTDCLRIDEGIT